MKGYWKFVLGIFLLTIGLKGYILCHHHWWSGACVAPIVWAIGLISGYWNRKEEP